MDRLKQLASHFAQPGSGKGREALFQQSPDDVVITFARRTALCRAKKGGFRDTHTDELMTGIFTAVVQHSGIDPKHFQDITVGNVLSPKATFEARAAAITAGIPQEVPLSVCNRFCSSGLLAVSQIANAIRAGQIDCGLAVGVESMSSNEDAGPGQLSDDIINHPVANDTTKPMGWTSENVAGDFAIPRTRMDEFAAL